jgi:hypothetical protein
MILETYSCEICITGQEETTQHLFYGCPFAQNCWGLLNLEIISTGTTFQNITAIKDQLQNRFFLNAAILMCWTIWKVRNELIFNNNQLGLQEAKTLFLKEVGLVSYMIKSQLK